MTGVTTEQLWVLILLLMFGFDFTGLDTPLPLLSQVRSHGFNRSECALEGFATHELGHSGYSNLWDTSK
jgi:hypothetical protein